MKYIWKIEIVTYYITYFTEINIALGKPAYQSTEAHGGKAER